MSRNPIRTLSPNSIWDEEAVKDAFEELEIKPQQYHKFMRELYEQFADDKIHSLDQYEIQDSNISRKVYKITQSGKFALMTSKIIRREDSSDRAATKLLIRLQDGEEVETVLMRYSNTQSTHTRTTICLSSQVGCAQACTFCATGMLGLSGSLTSGEIVEQFIWADARIEKIRNVVFMGQGEPLSNECYDNVLTAVKVFTGPRFLLKNDRVTISTVGIVHNIYKVIDTFPNVTIALSLHAPTQTMREKIVPSARKYALSDLVNAIDYYHLHTKKKMLIEYVMLDDINSSEETAHLLGKLLQGRGVMVNLIPFNPVLTKAKHIAPSPETVSKFAQIVASYNILVTERKELGQDISGACGQLATVSKSRKKRRGYQITDDMVPLTSFVRDDIITDADDMTSADIIDQEYHQQHQQHNQQKSQQHGDAAQEKIQNDNGHHQTGDKDQDEIDEDESSSDNELVTDGLEGLVSAMGWMTPEQSEQQQQQSSSSGSTDGNNTNHTNNPDTTSINQLDQQISTVHRSSILDNTGCGSGDGGDVDMEDLYKPTTKTKPVRPDGPSPIPAATPAAIALEHSQVFEEPKEGDSHSLAKYRDYRHYKATENIDPNDIIQWSLAIINLGPILRKEQMKKHGETKTHRQRRLREAFNSSTTGVSTTGGGGDANDPSDHPHGDGNGNGNGNGDGDGDEHSKEFSTSRSTSYLTGDGAASTMKIHIRRKDLQPRVFMPSKVEQQSIDLIKADWDAAPDRGRTTFDVPNEGTNTDDASSTAATNTTTTDHHDQAATTKDVGMDQKKVNQSSVKDQSQQLQQQQQQPFQRIAIMTIITCLSLLILRRLL